MKPATLLASAFAALLLPSSVDAASIVGVINFSSAGGGNLVLQDAAGNTTTSISLARGVKSWGTPKVGIVETPSSFTSMGVMPGQSVSFQEPWVFETALPSAPGSPLWSVAAGNFAFYLESATVTRPSATILNIEAAGMLTGDGFTPTPAIFFFSTQEPDTGSVFSWSASTEAVPEAGTSAILGVTLLGICLIRRRTSK